jgi:hypothetical protein
LFEKYNLIYVYPAEFDTKVIHRKTLIIYCLVAILLFQCVMYSIVGLLLSERVSVYLFAVIVIQIMVILTMLEFVRNPWDGKEMEIEKIINMNHNNIFDSLSSYEGEESRFDNSFSEHVNQTYVQGGEEKESCSEDNEDRRDQNLIRKDKWALL